MSFQKGDGHVVIAGTAYGLRLTMGALAELDMRLSVKGPKELSQRLRTLSPADGRVLLTCVMRPCLPSKDAAASADKFSDKDIAGVMPAICRLFEEAFLHD